eukprot:956652-Karenia_brevis.AAC.1
MIIVVIIVIIIVVVVIVIVILLIISLYKELQASLPVQAKATVQAQGGKCGRQTHTGSVSRQ